MFDPKSPNQPHAFDSDNPSRFYGNQPGRIAFTPGGPLSTLLAENKSNAEFLWRVEATGENCLFRLNWGVRSGLVITDLQPPLVAFLPGTFQLEAIHRNTQAAGFAVANLTCATGGTPHLRNVVTRAGANVTLQSMAKRLQALTAVTVTVDGIAVVLAPLDRLELSGPCVVTADGSALVEYEC